MTVLSYRLTLLLAISEDERKESLIKAQSVEIKHLQDQLARMKHEFEGVHHENNALRNEAQFRPGEFNSQTPYGGPPSSSHSSTATLGHNNFTNGHYERPRTQPEPQQHSLYSSRSTELPPLRAINGSGPEAMSGVQYQQQDLRTNGFRSTDRF